MKSKVNFLLIVILAVGTTSCSNDKSAKEILDNPESQDEVLAAIVNDSSLLAKLHNKMMAEGRMNSSGGTAMMQSCMSMMDDPEMMSMMMDNMMMRSEKDTAMCEMMCDKMMGSDNMRSMMQDRMQRGMKMKN
jgi:hypothetical protein